MTALNHIPGHYLSVPFRVEDALRDGVPRTVLYGPRFRRPFPGVRVPCTLPDTLMVRCQAASLVTPPKAAFSHQTAAVICELPLPEPPAAPLHVIVEPGTTVPRIDGIIGHDGHDVADAIDVAGVRVVHPARTFVHLAPLLTVDQLVILGDAIVRRWATRDELVGRVSDLVGRRGIVKARRAVALVRDGSDSPPETRVRLMLIRAGLPEPELNRDVFDDLGRWIARPDLSYPRLKIAIEYDGDHHRTDKRQWRRDRTRDEDLRAAGWIVITLTADDVFRTPQQTVARIWRDYAQRAGR